MPRSARFAFGSVACVLALGVACSSEAPVAPTIVDRAVYAGGSPAPPIRISGRVLDWASGASAANVAVELGGVQVVTDANGAYTMTLPAPGPYDPIVAGLSSGVSHVSGPSYRGDFLTNAGTCVTRYGTVSSARTGRPLAGAAVSLGSARTTSGTDGWYRIDLGCPGNGQGFNPSSFNVTLPGYIDWSELETRGVFATVRIDLELFPTSDF